jgi:hypothetical protein
VFTLPEILGRLALQNAREIYSILFRAASETLLTIAADPKRLGAAIGFLAVLHTWGQNLHLHPHLHCVVPGGGISTDGKRWIPCRKSSFFLPVRVSSSRFRSLFLICLRDASRKDRLKFNGEMSSLAKPAAFEALCRRPARIKWVVFAKAPFGGPGQVLKYLARYTHRVAISNARLLSMEDGRVSFEYKDYADGNKSKVMTLEATEFIRRFLQHMLPAGSVRIRQFGSLANRARKKKLAFRRELLGAPPASADVAVAASPVASGCERDHKLCPACGTGHMIRITIAQWFRFVTPLPLQDSS